MEWGTRVRDKWVTLTKPTTNKHNGGNKMIWAIIATVLVAWFAYKLRLKMVKPYEGRHHIGSVATVPATYHPSDSAWVPVPVRNRAWWNARMARMPQVRHLALPLKEFLIRAAERTERFEQEALAWLARDYRWMDIPLSEWPREWLQARPANVVAIKIGGSDVPARDDMRWRMAA